MDLSMSAHSPAGSPAHDDGLIVDSSTARFQADVLEASLHRPVLVDFWAPWCGPCKQLTPALEKVVREQGGKIALVKINVDENQALAGQMGVQSIPAVFAFLGGRPVDGFMGAVPESEIVKFATKLIEAADRAGIAAPDDAQAQIKAALEAAAQALEANDIERAYQIYAAVLQHVPDNVPALVGIARLQFKSGDLDAAKATLDMLPQEHGDADATALAKAIALAEQAAALGDAAPLQARLQDNPDDHAARFDLAMILNARDEKLAAAEALVEIMRRDRTWNDDGARLKLLELFETWGFKDPATIRGRRLLSTLLFS